MFFWQVKGSDNSMQVLNNKNILYKVAEYKGVKDLPIQRLEAK